jgi:hypothetical protein
MLSRYASFTISYVIAFLIYTSSTTSTKLPLASLGVTNAYSNTHVSTIFFLNLYLLQEPKT